MKFLRLGSPGSEIPAALINDRYFDLRPVTADINGTFLAGDPAGRTSEAIEAGALPEIVGAADLRVGAPISRPGTVVCIGMNYAEHAAESGALPPTTPVMFLKASNTVVGPNDPITIPRGSEKTDWEVELGIVVGRTASYLDSEDDALDHVAGYVTANDVSERAFQIEHSGGQWSKGKCAPGFTPIGPWLVTPEEVRARSLFLRSSVNGQPRQSSSTADMIFPVAHIVWQLSQYLTLDPGDLILTGTPAGVALSGRYPYLRPGDIVETEVQGLGAQRQRFVAWEPAR
jgi:2-keto-4-pentenoate hydratase/2-oxohepta-3-ene-1,7-dioic acid hydratase in catechol pathway